MDDFPIPSGSITPVPRLCLMTRSVRAGCRCIAPANQRPRGSGGWRGTLDASHDYDRKRNGTLCPTERSRRLADARPVCAAAWAADTGGFSWRAAGRANLRHQGFRDVRLSAGLLSPGELLARRASALESIEPLRGSLPGPMEHADPLPVLAHLSAAALELVPVLLLSGASLLGRVGHVFPRLSLDPPPLGGGIGRADLRIQRPIFECADVAKHRGHVRLAALGRVAGAAGLAGGWEKDSVGDARGRRANAGGLMLGWFSAEAALASCTKRARRSGPVLRASASSLMATKRSRRLSRAL